LLIDGSLVPSAVLDTQIPLEPGDHAIVLSGSGRTAKANVRLAMGANEQVTLRWEREQSTAIAPNAVITPTNPIKKSEVKSGDSSTLRWVSLGIGAAGVLTGAIAGGLVLSQNQELKRDCSDNHCPPDTRDELRSFRHMRTISTAGFAVGIVGLGAFSVLVFTAPNRPKEGNSVARLHGWVGLNSVGLSGEY
jgi:hypothetical protein